jgi:hypothetical protein
MVNSQMGMVLPKNQMINQLINQKGRLMFHEIHGKKHPMPSQMNKRYFDYLKTHYRDFVTLCYFHHTYLHQFAKLRKLKLFLLLIKELRKTKRI